MYDIKGKPYLNSENNNGPLTAVPSVSLTVTANCPCFYSNLYAYDVML